MKEVDYVKLLPEGGALVFFKDGSLEGVDDDSVVDRRNISE